MSVLWGKGIDLYNAEKVITEKIFSSGSEQFARGEVFN